jgi:hypothetical protein
MLGYVEADFPIRFSAREAHAHNKVAVRNARLSTLWSATTICA